MSDVFLKAFGAMGANPTPLAVNGVFQALSTHLIDGAENNWPTFESARHLEIAKFWSQTEHSYSPEILTMSKQRFEAMSPADREMILDAAVGSGDAGALGEVLGRKSREGAEAGCRGQRGRSRGIPRQRCGPGEDETSDPVLASLYRRVRDLTG